MTNEPHQIPDDDAAAQANAERASVGSSLHDMGGDIGPASIRAGGAPAEGVPGDEAAPSSGFSTPVSPMVGDDDQDPSLAGSPASDVSPVGSPVNAEAGTPYADGPDAERSGRGADGDYEARLAQKREGGP